MNCKISINQLADYARATDKSKLGILRRQKDPDLFRLPWYRSSKAAIIKSLRNHGDLDIVRAALEKLRGQKAETAFQENNRMGSIEALERFLSIRIPKDLKGLNVEIVKPEKKHLTISNVEVIIAPDLIIKSVVADKTVVGAVKIHSSKNKPFELEQARLVSSVMYKYLKNEVALENEFVLPELCLCLDVFSGRFISTPKDFETRFDYALTLCTEINRLWPAA